MNELELAAKADELQQRPPNTVCIIDPSVATRREVEILKVEMARRRPDLTVLSGTFRMHLHLPDPSIDRGYHTNEEPPT